MAEQQEIKQPKNKYFHIILNMADDDLDPYEYRLLGHYIRVGVTFEGTRTTARITKMSVGKVVSTRNTLEAKGFIRMEKPESQADTVRITVVDRMQENITRYCSPDEHSVQDMNTKRSPDEQKKNSSKKNQEENNAGYAAIPEQSPRILKEQTAKPYYDAIVVVFNLHGGRNANMEKMLQGVAIDKAHKPYNMPSPVLLDELQLWDVWRKRKYPHISILQSPEKVQSSILEYRAEIAKQSVATPTSSNGTNAAPDSASIALAMAQYSQQIRREEMNNGTK